MSSSKSNSPLLSCVMAITSTDKDRSLLSDLFPDIVFCVEHHKLVESNLRVISLSKVDMPDPMQSCGVCPKKEYVEIDFLKTLQEKPLDLDEARKAWTDIISKQPGKKPETSERDLIKKSIEERRLWFQYMNAAYIVGISRSAQMKLNADDRNPKAEINKYEDVLMQFYTHCQLRNSNSKNKQDTICQQLCVEHDHLGDFVPYRPMYIYEDCTICERPKRPRKMQAQTERLNEGQMFSNVSRRKQ